MSTSILFNESETEGNGTISSATDAVFKGIFDD